MKKQFKLFSLLAVIIVGMFAVAGRLFFSAANATYVEGIIAQDTIWTPTDSPFVVSKDLIVAPAVTLTIMPGVEVRFGGNFSLFVGGRLVADGTQDNWITFTSNKGNPSAGDWNTIQFFSGTQPSSLAYCLIEYAVNGTTIQSSNVKITNSKIRNNLQYAINMENGTLEVTNSEISNNAVGGITVKDGDVKIQNNEIRTSGTGIFLTGNLTLPVDISQNTVLLNNQSGIQIDVFTYSSLTILYNTVSSNGKGFYVSGWANTQITNNSVAYNTIGIFYESEIPTFHVALFNDIYGNAYGMDVSLEATVDASYNYWGDESGPYHTSLNPNGKGNLVGGDGVNLDFIFFLTSPIAYINQRPTANLLSDMRVVRPNQSITFFATTSTDDGRVDQYYFNFGDGQNSSWTPLSVFVHQYSSVGTYYATVTVLDDFGVNSNNVATVRIDVQDLPSLTVSLTPSYVNMGSEKEQPITVYATDGTSPVADANITLFSLTGRSVTYSSGLTDSTGYLTSSFSAPNVVEKTYVRITATASKNGYADGSDFEYLSVLPLLSVQVTLSSSSIKSEATINGTVHVTHNENPVEGVAVTISSDNGGSFSPANGTTNANGDFKFTFIAPQTLTQVNATITATATKSDYWDGVAQTTITITPRTLVVQVIANPNIAESSTTSSLIVHVTSEGNPVEDATVSVSSDNGGTFSIASGNTDAYGDVRLNFTAPEATAEIDVTITANADKSGYVNGQGQTKITVTPVPSPQSEVFGLPLTTLLLIIIPIVVVVIVVVLIKAKIIVFSSEES